MLLTDSLRGLEMLSSVKGWGRYVMVDLLVQFAAFEMPNKINFLIFAHRHWVIHRDSMHPGTWGTSIAVY